MTNSRVRLNAYHNAKSRLVGSRAAHVSPAWRATNIPVAVQTQMKTQVNRSTLAVLPGAGKILINNLPVDVMLEEIVDLFKKTVGATKDAIMCHDPRGRPLGIAIVSFVNPSHAAAARAKFNKKVIDGRRELQIELVYDSDPPKPAPPLPIVTEPPKSKTLLDRLGGPTSLNGAVKKNAVAGPSKPTSQHRTTVPVSVKPLFSTPPTGPRHLTNRLAVPPSVPVSSVRQRFARVKKGPRRVHKLATAADLDKEMDDYNAERVAMLT